MILHKLIPAIIVALSSMPQEGSTYALRQAPVVGHESTVDLKIKLESSDFNMDMSMAIFEKITKVEEDGAYESEITTLEGLVKLNGDENPIPKGEPEVTKFDKNGKEIKKDNDPVADEDPIATMISIVTDYEPKKPVKVGDSWVMKSPYGSLDAKLEGKEVLDNVPCLKISVAGKLTEKNATGDVSGTVYLQEKDFEFEKLNMTIGNAKIGEDAPAVKFSIDMQRKKKA